MKGSFLIKASDLLTKNSIFHGAVVLKVGDKEYLEKGVLFLTPKGFNIRFLCNRQVFTVFLGNIFNKESLVYFRRKDFDLLGIFSFDFSINVGENEVKKENYFFTQYVYPNYKTSFYYESNLAKNSFQKFHLISSKLTQNSSQKTKEGIIFNFCVDVLAECLNELEGICKEKLDQDCFMKIFLTIDKVLNLEYDYDRMTLETEGSRLKYIGIDSNGQYRYKTIYLESYKQFCDTKGVNLND